MPVRSARPLRVRPIRATYLDQLLVRPVGVFLLQDVSTALLVTEEGRDGLFGGILILLSFLRLPLLLDLHFDLLRRRGRC